MADEATLSPDWVMRATRHHVGLTGSAPVSAYIPEPRPRGWTRIDIHQGIEVGIVLAGTHARGFEDWALSLEPGDVWLCAMWEPHAVRVLSDQGSTLGIVFLPEFLGDERFEGRSWLSMFALPPRQRPRVTSASLRERMLAIGRHLEAEFARKQPGWMTAVRLGVLQVLFQLSRHWSPPPAARPVSPVYASDLTRIMPALRLLQADPSRTVKQLEAAAACGLSASRFSRIFANVMSMSFARFRLRARLAYVAHQLLTTDLPVEAIALEAGFVDDSHLIHAFAKHYACTPGQYRRQTHSARPQLQPSALTLSPRTPPAPR